MNSFGFGGANSHAILEEYRPPYTNSEHKKGFSSTEACLVPFLFSASSETTLRRILSGYSSHLLTTANISPQDLAFTLSSKRSSLAHRAYFAADSLQDLQMQLARRNDDKTSNFPRAGLRKGGTIGVFTGQVSLRFFIECQKSHASIGGAVGRHGQTAYLEIPIRQRLLDEFGKEAIRTR